MHLVAPIVPWVPKFRFHHISISGALQNNKVLPQFRPQNKVNQATTTKTTNDDERLRHRKHANKAPPQNEQVPLTLHTYLSIA